jgi:protease-4
MALVGLALWRAGREPSIRPSPSGPGHGDTKTLAGGDGAIAVVTVRGILSFSGGGFGQDDAAEGTIRRLRQLKDDDGVQAVILRINSPGGTVASVQEVHEAVRALQRTGKKVVASFEDVAASGGYYIAAPADRIVANPGSLVGSIGVIFHLYNVEELARKVGVGFQVIKSGAMKDIGSATRPMTAEERSVFEGLVRSAYGQFVNAVAEGRKMPLDKLRPLADGRIFTGEQALKEGLVDALGGFDQAVEEARRAAGIRSPSPRLIMDEKPWGRILDLLKGGAVGSFARWTRWAAPRATLEYVWE